MTGLTNGKSGRGRAGPAEDSLAIFEVIAALLLDLLERKRESVAARERCASDAELDNVANSIITSRVMGGSAVLVRVRGARCLRLVLPNDAWLDNDSVESSESRDGLEVPSEALSVVSKNAEGGVKAEDAVEESEEAKELCLPWVGIQSSSSSSRVTSKN